MKFNPPRAARAVLYLLATFATPTVLYLSSTGRIGDALTVLLGSYITLTMGLATANTASSGGVDPAPRPERGVLRPVFALMVAFTMAIAGTLLMLASSPAQAVGWSGQRCHTGSDGWRVCTQLHTVNNGSKLWVDTFQICMTMWDSNSHIRGSVANGWGTNTGLWGGLPKTGKSDCAYTYPTKAAGTTVASACYSASGRIDRSIFPDANWSTGGRITGGAC